MSEQRRMRTQGETMSDENVTQLKDTVAHNEISALIKARVELRKRIELHQQFFTAWERMQENLGFHSKHHPDCEWNDIGVNINQKCSCGRDTLDELAVTIRALKR